MGDKMKYSIIMPYYKRDFHLYNTLISFAHHYKDRDDFEVVIVEDIKNIEDEGDHNKLLDVIDKFSHVNIKRIDSNFVNCYNPAPLFNLGVKESSGKYLILTNPEVFHKVNIFDGLDSLFGQDKNVYVVCGCENVIKYPQYAESFEKFTYEHHQWYQHSKHRNALFHFCSAISKENYLKIGGFDERYKDGIAHDDNDFRDTVFKNKIKVLVNDNLHTLHLAHDSAFSFVKDEGKLMKRNELLYVLKKQGRSDDQINKVLNCFD